MFLKKPLQYRFPFIIITAWLAVLFIAGCGVVPRNYQPNRPFVYQTNINVEGNLSKEEKNRLTSQLENQLDDSLQVRTSYKFFYKGFNRPIVNKPPVYDSSAADKSIIYMKSLLKSLGYYYDSIGYSKSIKKVEEDQYRTTVNFIVKPGKQIKLDSVSYNFRNPELQNLAQTNIKDAVVKKGDAFAKPGLAAERERLVDVYRNNGYLRFTANEIIGLWDTLDISMLQPTFDPFEQMALLEKLIARRENPTANIEFQLKQGIDSARLIKYFIGNITVFPDINPDTAGIPKKSISLDNGKFKIIYHRNLFKSKLLKRNVYLTNGELYRQQDYLRTVNRFNNLGAWKLVNLEQFPRAGTDTVDFHLRLSPADKYSYNVTLDGNNSQSTITGNLWGIGLQLGFQNRNFAKSANQSVTNFRYGVEFGKGRGIQTQQTSFSQNVYIPRLILPGNTRIAPKYRDHARTIFSFGAARTLRKDYFNLTSINGSWGYEFQLADNKLLTLRIPNFEYSFLDKKEKLIELIRNNQLLKNLFTDGLIISSVAKYDVSWGKATRLNFFRFNFEESGLFSGVFKNNFFDTNLYRFIKVDAEISRKVVLKKWNDGTDKTVLAMRLFGGVGYELGSTIHPDKRNNLPFFKAYFAGGPNSMRAWQLRRLGQGSLIKKFDDSSGTPERFGDIQIEANMEYRFLLFKYAGVRFNGALFADVGNVWFLKKAAAPTEPESVFNINRLWKDLAVGVGGGLRIDFSLFILRLDYAYKAKDPSPDPSNAASQNKWFYNIKPLNGTFQLGINYPFVL